MNYSQSKLSVQISLLVKTPDSNYQNPDLRYAILNSYREREKESKLHWLKVYQQVCVYSSHKIWQL
jgi:hypothetical protein